VLDSWLFTLETDVAAADPGLAERERAAVDEAVEQLLERRLATVSVRTPAFAQALRAYRAAVASGDATVADALAAWIGGQPHVAAAAKRGAGIRGELDHFGAMGFLQGLLEVLRDAGHPGLLLMLDEVETLQRVRGDVRDKALNALRQLLDEIDADRYPGLFLVITGTPAFYDGPSGVPRLPPLAQRLATDFSTDPRFDNPRLSSCGCPASAGTRWSPSAPGSVICTPTVRPTVIICSRRWMTVISGNWPTLSPGRWAGKWGSLPGCTSRSWSPTCWTGWTSSPTSTPAATTGSPWPQVSYPRPNAMPPRAHRPQRNAPTTSTSTCREPGGGVMSKGRRQ
jgi:hypothetical protein